MDVKAYLSRIGCEVPAEPNLEALRCLHIKHLTSVPFENLTFHSRGRVVLDLPTVYDKIVNQRQGGCCCENNMLFKWLLSKLGYNVTTLGAQVKSFITGCFDPPCAHMILMVTLDEKRWLCDVGYGVPGYFFPLSLETDDLQPQGHRAYRVRLENGMRFLEWQKEQNNGPDGEWTIISKFTLEPRNLEDFIEMCNFHQTSRYSKLFNKSICTMLIPGTVSPGGRITYVGHKLSISRFPSQETGRVLREQSWELRDEEIPALLEEKFGLKLKNPVIPKDDPVMSESAVQEDIRTGDN